MSVVSNTSPLLNLAIIGELELVRDQFKSVLVPPAVVEEFRLGQDRAGSSVLRREVEEGWIEVQDPDEEALIHTLSQDLDGGEAEAIALAVEKNVGQVLIDEREGRRRARKVGLEVTGVLGFSSEPLKEEPWSRLPMLSTNSKKRLDSGSPLHFESRSWTNWIEYQFGDSPKPALRDRRQERIPVRPNRGVPSEGR